MKKLFITLSLLVFSMFLFSCSSESEDTSWETKVADRETIPKFGMILVGPRDDKGWSQAHFEGGQYLANIHGAEMITVDFVNPADSPNLTVDQVAADMIAEGAELIIATSDDMKDGILVAAENNPEVSMIWASGDSAKSDGKNYRPDLTNLANVMGKMEYGKMIAGCAAAIQSENGHISFLGPLINDETRRLANAAYLGAKHCWKMSGGDRDDLDFRVVWIGFWFHIPGVTSDPTQVANEFFDNGSDVIISHIDTPEALIVTEQRALAGENVWVVGYDYEFACDLAPTRCLGVPYFNWGPAYNKLAHDVAEDIFEAKWHWNDPNWDNLNDPDTSPIGFHIGDALNDVAMLEEFIDGLASGEINLYKGPIKYQNGKGWIVKGSIASDNDIWYSEMLLEGMVGDIK